MSLTPPVRELRVPHALQRMRMASTGRYLADLGRRHLRDGLPQLATFAFDHVGRAITIWGRYEREELELLMAATAPFVARDGACLDVGANIGNHAVFFADHFRTVLAFEPNLRCFALLQINAALKDNIECFGFGLSDVDGPSTLHIPPGNAGMGSVGGTAVGEGATVACELRRLDGLQALASRRVAMIKIDVEGHEPDVLRGARQLLARDRPVVVFEQAAEAIAEGSSAAIDVLREAGYARFWVVEHRPASGSRLLDLALRLLVGERLRLVECERFEKRFHSMIVALPSAAG